MIALDFDTVAEMQEIPQWIESTSYATGLESLDRLAIVLGEELKDRVVVKGKPITYPSSDKRDGRFTFTGPSCDSF